MWLLMRYGAAGAFGAFVQTFTLYVWVSWLHLEHVYLLGAVLGFCIALVVTFLLQKYWTFRDHSMHRTYTQLFWYSVVALLNVSLNVGLLAFAKALFTAAGINFFHIWYLIVQIAIVVFASGVSFVLNYFFTFRHDTMAVTESFESSPLV
jgi:putative flippase GtrA